RARDSVSPTTISVAPIRKATSASANQRAPSLELMGTTPRVPRSSGGRVGRGAEVVGFFTNWLRCHNGSSCSIQFNAYNYLSDLWKSLWKLCTGYNLPKLGKKWDRDELTKFSKSHK